MIDRNFMPIGRFALSCRLSVKALRHYDKLGLLKPAFVDPQSKYRYYSREQARSAVMIGMLRSLSLPIPVIRRALAAEPDELRVILDAETARIETELAEQKKTLLSLRHIARAGGLAPYEIGIRQHPERNVARILGTTDADHLLNDSTELVYTLLDELRCAGVELNGSVLTITDMNTVDDRITLHACAEVNSEPHRLRRAEVARLTGGPFACLTHVGPYEILGLAHSALQAWVQERGHSSLASMWEFYVNDPAHVPPEQLVTEVALPLAEDEHRR